MGINSAADKVKWAAINFMDHTLPRVHTTLFIADNALRSMEAVVHTIGAMVDALEATVLTETLPRTHTTLSKADEALQSMDAAARSVDVMVDALKNTLLTETLPRVHSALFSVDRAMHSIDVAARGIDTTAGILRVILPIISLTVIAHYYICSRRDRQIHVRKLNRYYLRTHYGDNIETASKTYINLIKFYSCRVYESIVDVGADETKVVLVGANEEVEGYIWDQRAHDQQLHQLLFADRRFMFRSIKDAMEAVDEYCKLSDVASKPKRTKTLFIFILISSQDPSIFGPQEHESFTVPSSLRDSFYAIVGTGFHKIAAHKLPRSSIGPDAKLLVASLPTGTKETAIMQIIGPVDRNSYENYSATPPLR